MKKLMSIRKFKIYEISDAELRRSFKDDLPTPSRYYVFQPEDTPATGYPDWEADSLQECIDFITSY